MGATPLDGCLSRGQKPPWLKKKEAGLLGARLLLSRY
jgi:hypothetical protein